MPLVELSEFWKSTKFNRTEQTSPCPGWASPVMQAEWAERRQWNGLVFHLAARTNFILGLLPDHPRLHRDSRERLCYRCRCLPRPGCMAWISSKTRTVYGGKQQQPACSARTILPKKNVEGKSKFGKVPTLQRLSSHDVVLALDYCLHSARRSLAMFLKKQSSATTN